MTPTLPKGFYLQRGERLFGVSGWWKDQNAAMRFQTREDAQAAIAEQGLGDDVRVVERPYQPGPMPPREDQRDYDPFAVVAA
jgi:hypothetical protein